MKEIAELPVAESVGFLEQQVKDLRHTVIKGQHSYSTPALL
jgi:hypothetical protein